MKSIYNRSHQVVACILLLSLFLQSCEVKIDDKVGDSNSIGGSSDNVSHEHVKVCIDIAKKFSVDSLDLEKNNVITYSEDFILALDEFYESLVDSESSCEQVPARTSRNSFSGQFVVTENSSEQSVESNSTIAEQSREKHVVKEKHLRGMSVVSVEANEKASQDKLTQKKESKKRKHQEINQLEQSAKPELSLNYGNVMLYNKPEESNKRAKNGTINILDQANLDARSMMGVPTNMTLASVGVEDKVSNKSEIQETRQERQLAKKNGSQQTYGFEISFDNLQKRRNKSREHTVESSKLKKLDLIYYEKGIKFYNDQNYLQAKDYFIRAAELGNINAQYMIGKLYLDGVGVEKDLNLSKEWFERAVAQGNLVAKQSLNYVNMLITAYYPGKRVTMEHQKIRQFEQPTNAGLRLNYGDVMLSDKPQESTKRAKNGTINILDQANLDAQSMMGVPTDITVASAGVEDKVSNKSNSQETRQEKQPAKKNDSQQSYGVKISFDNLQKHRSKSREHTVKSSDQANLDTQSVKGVSPDRAVASVEVRNESTRTNPTNNLTLITPSDNGDKELALMCYNAGMELYNQKNYSQAEAYFIRAANLDNINAYGMIGYLYYYGKVVNITFFQAVGYLEKAVQKDNLDAQTLLGLIYYKGGEGVPRNLQKTKECFEKAATQNHLKAQVGMGILHCIVEGGWQNDLVAKWWLHKASTHDLLKDTDNLEVAKLKSNIAYCLGKIFYREGMGLYSLGNYLDAKICFERAAEQNDVGAQIALGLLYLDGFGVEKDLNLSKAWFEKAAAQGDAAAESHLDYVNMLLPSYCHAQRVTMENQEIRQLEQPENIGSDENYGSKIISDKPQESGKSSSKDTAELSNQAMMEVSTDVRVTSVETEDKPIRKNLSTKKVTADKPSRKKPIRKRVTANKSTTKEASTNYQERSQLEQAANIGLSVNYSDEMISDKSQENTKRPQRDNVNKPRKSVKADQVPAREKVTRKRKHQGTKQEEQQPANIGFAEDDIDEIGVSDKSQENTKRRKRNNVKKSGRSVTVGQVPTKKRKRQEIKQQEQQPASIGSAEDHIDEVGVSDKSQENTKRPKRNNVKKPRESEKFDQVPAREEVTKKRKYQETKKKKQQPANIGSAEDHIAEIGVFDKSQERNEQSRKEAVAILDQPNCTTQAVMDLLNLRGNSLNQTDRMVKDRDKDLDFGAESELIHIPKEASFLSSITELGMSYYMEGMEFYKQQDYIKAKKLFKKAAEQNNTSAQNMMGILYYHGYGVNQNYIRAQKWHKRAARQGDLAALDHLKHINHLIETLNLEHST